MAVMVGSLYDALIKAGADGESAKRAAEEVASFDLKVTDLKMTIDLRVNEVKTQVGQLDARMEARFAALTWMVGVVLTLLILVLGGLLGLLWRCSPSAR